MIGCPACQSGRIHQSRRKGIVERGILTVIFVRPFRCERCDSRFYRWSMTAKRNSSGAGKGVVRQNDPV
jgi:hypothetical protein